MHNSSLYGAHRDFIFEVPNSSENTRYEANDDFAYTMFSTIAAFVTQGLWC